MKTFIYDEFSPEDVAMMQALYSRSAQSVTEHAEKVKRSGSGKFMEKFYVGYGHASIADCGSTTVFIEDVSMLVAKAVQDWPLYSGQETSSRYVDMSKRLMIDPVKTRASKSILDRWMKFYLESQGVVEDHLRIKYPKCADEDEVVYDRAIKARVFDILRGFLPAGVTTQLSWHTNLRQAHDKLVLMQYYPLKEVQQVAQDVHEKLQTKYAHSFGHKTYPEQEKYRALIGQKYTFYPPVKLKKDFITSTTIRKKDLIIYRDLLKKRPVKTNLPHFLTELGQVTFQFPMDFGSFRDIQRHRNGVCRMPLLTTKLGFNTWYLDQLPDDTRRVAEKLIREQIKAIKTLKGSKEELQYYIAMGFNVGCKVTYGLPAAVYTLELRSGKLVHPTLRIVAHKMYKDLHNMFPELVLHVDLDKDDWDVRRGLQDIKEKK